MMKINDIAKICYEANITYCEILNDKPVYRAEPWEDAPNHVKDSIISGVTCCIEGDVSCPEDMHNAWLVYKGKAGWKYGEKKDNEAKTHPNILPYKELPPEQQFKDKLFLAIVKACTEHNVARIADNGTGRHEMHFVPKKPLPRNAIISSVWDKYIGERVSVYDNCDDFLYSGVLLEIESNNVTIKRDNDDIELISASSIVASDKKVSIFTWQ